MSREPDLLAGLERRLNEIPEAKFVEIVRLLEQIGEHPRVRETFETIRPRLARVRPMRRLTLKRVFCDPFEDVLDTAPPGDATHGHISRAIIDPLWRVVEERADARHMQAMQQQVRGIAATDGHARHTLGCRLWYVAATTLRQALKEAEQNPRQRRALLGGGEELLAEARQAVEYLEIGHAIAEVKRVLSPKPFLELLPEHVAFIEEHVVEVAKAGTNKPACLLAVAAARLREPAELLAALGGMEFGKARREKAAVFAALSGIVVDGLEERAGSADRAPPDPNAAVTMAEQLVESLESTHSVMSLVNETKYDERLGGVRSAVGRMVEQAVLTPAAGSILGSLPVPATDAVPMLPPDDGAQLQAEDHARALRRCQRFAGAIGLDHAVSETLATIGKGVEKQVGRVLDSLGRTGVGGEERDTVEQSLFYAVRLMELVAGSGHADELLRRTMETLDGPTAG
ncbi:hypothetical protein HL658_22950 [Azospirillum sp. RWY-5-1]|uniref:DUF1631 domain-containing protein n=1 Tax=Azospirillum oleiclasticum TaxID=2735135 RepID=A0ABX2THD8_9PROT|nr:hypothetical protein [Azospirillum oleiclasticum]NYZ15407.1 hypothetical protein [Azospirillum oleiclasticum]NYZ22429.1 hypothetical protein [Azospirillum oleiclasticum]